MLNSAARHVNGRETSTARAGEYNPDFLIYDLIVGPGHRCVRQQSSHTTITGIVSRCESPFITLIHDNTEYAALLQQFPMFTEPIQ